MAAAVVGVVADVEVAMGTPTRGEAVAGVSTAGEAVADAPAAELDPDVPATEALGSEVPAAEAPGVGEPAASSPAATTPAAAGAEDEAETVAEEDPVPGAEAVERAGTAPSGAADAILEVASDTAPVAVEAVAGVDAEAIADPSPGGGPSAEAIEVPVDADMGLALVEPTSPGGIAVAAVIEPD